MKYLKYILLLVIINSVNAEDITVNFNHSNMFGINIEKMQFDNIIIGLPFYEPVEELSFNEEESIAINYVMSYEEINYSTSFKACRYNSGRLYLLPQLTPEEAYCDIAEGLDLFNSYGFSLETDRVQINNIISNGIVHNITFKFNFDTLQLEQDDGIIVLPSSAPDHIRIILDWYSDLPELDAHLTGPIAPYSFEHFHLYFHDIYNNGNVATLNVGYDEFETRPEVVTILPPIINFETQQRDTILRPGFYRFTVQHFYGNGNLLDSNAKVRLQIGNDPHEYLFELPNYEGLELLGEMDIWIVFELEVLNNGTVNINPIQRYELGISPSEVL